MQQESLPMVWMEQKWFSGEELRYVTSSAEYYGRSEKGQKSLFFISCGNQWNSNFTF
jgi:hypothetical protein